MYLAWFFEKLIICSWFNWRQVNHEHKTETILPSEPSADISPPGGDGMVDLFDFTAFAAYNGLTPPGNPVDSDAFASLTDAVLAIGSAEKTLIVSTPEKVPLHNS